MTQPVFFYGVVENNVDPERLGRVQVRFHGLHTSQKVQDDTTGIPTSDLPWAICAPSITEAGVSGIGQAPVGIVQGAWVMGVFRDKGNQSPVVFATLPGRPGSSGRPSEGFSDPAGVYPLTDRLGESDVNRLARNEKIDQTIVEQKKKNIYTGVQTAGADGSQWSEPANPYATEYPMNSVHESRSGHIHEIDDTKDHERLHRYHRTGTFEEIHPDGSMVTKIIGDNFTILMQDDNVVVNGACNLTVIGPIRIKSEDSIYVDAAKNMTFRAKEEIKFEAKNITSIAEEKIKTSSKTNEFAVSESATITTGTFLDIKTSSSLKIDAGSFMTVNCTNLNIKGSSGPSTWQQNGALNLVGTPATLNNGAVAITSPVPALPLDTATAQIASSAGSFETAVSTEVGAVIAGANARDDDKEVDKVPNLTPAKPIPVVVGPCGLTISDPIDYEMTISGPFKLKDFTRLTFAGHHELIAQHGYTTQGLVCNLKALCDNILIPLSTAFPGMRINSGFRAGTYDKKGNVIKSQHNRGMAADVSWPNVASGAAAKAHADAVYNWLWDNKLPFDQLISEKQNSMWIHISFDPSKKDQRREVRHTPNAATTPPTPGWVSYSGTWGGHPNNNPPENLF